MEGDWWSDWWRITNGDIVDQQTDLLGMQGVARHAWSAGAAGAAAATEWTRRIIPCGPPRRAMANHGRRFRRCDNSGAELGGHVRRQHEIACGFSADRVTGHGQDAP